MKKKSVESPLFKAKDPLGRTVRLYPEQWKNHIYKDHPEMRNRYKSIQKTIIDPQYILESSINTNEIYSSNAVTTTGIYINVVVGIEDSCDDWFVRTAYPTPYLLAGTIKWKKSK